MIVKYRINKYIDEKEVRHIDLSNEDYAALWTAVYTQAINPSNNKHRREQFEKLFKLLSKI